MKKFAKFVDSSDLVIDRVIDITVVSIVGGKIVDATNPRQKNLFFLVKFDPNDDFVLVNHNCDLWIDVSSYDRVLLHGGHDAIGLKVSYFLFWSFLSIHR